MQSPWSIDPGELERRFVDGEGGEFVRFMRDLIRASLLAAALPESDIHISGPIKAKDGGVDATVRRVSNTAIEPSGWLGVPTVWQFKAENRPSLQKALREIKKPLVQRQMRRGYAYRFCVAHELQTVVEWEDRLREAAARIAPGAPEPRVVGAEELARWVEHFPALVQRWFTPELGIWKDHRAWEREESGAPCYRPIAAWESTAQRILDHARPGSTSEVLLDLRGLAGVGKTRLVLESLRPLKPLVAYTRDAARARNYAYHLAGERAHVAVLVVDECTVEIAGDLEKALRPVADRVRLIVIGNDLRPQTFGGLWLDQMSDDDLAAVLASNFPGLEEDPRAQIVETARGFVRLAVDMAQYAQRHSDPREMFGRVETYLERRFTSKRPWWDALLLASLVTHVGFRGAVHAELRGLCGACGADVDATVKALSELHEQVGFIGVAGDHYYVTPEAVATTAFEVAWHNFASRSPADFIGRLPGELFERFHRRVERCSNKEVRDSIAGSFRLWASSLTPAEICSSGSARSLACLVSIDPEEFLPVVAHLVRTPTASSLIEGRSHPRAWSARHEIASVLSRAAQYPEFFSIAEVSLRRLALLERSRSLADNANGAWRRLFRPVLSGTALPFQTRLKTLRRLLEGADEAEQALAFDALDHAFEPRAIGLRQAPFVAHPPPPEWAPSPQESSESARELHALLVDLAIDQRAPIRFRAQEIAARHSRIILQATGLRALERIFASEDPPATALQGLTQGVETFLKFDARPETGDAAYGREVEDWFTFLASSNLRTQLLTVVSSHPWYRGDELGYTRAVHDIAMQLSFDPIVRTDTLNSLATLPRARTFDLGAALARLDESGARLREILGASKQGHEGLARGYVSALLERRPESASAINDALDELCVSLPDVAVLVARVDWKTLHLVERLITLVASGALPLKHLEVLNLSGVAQTHGPDAVTRVLDVVVARVMGGDRDAPRVGVNLLSPMASDSSRTAPWPVPWIDRALTILEAAPRGASVDTTEWSEALARLSTFAPDRSLTVVAHAMLAHDPSLWEPAMHVLLTVAPIAPQSAAETLGDVLLDPRHPGLVAVFRPAVSAIPTEAWSRWLDRVGVSGARALAAHLPRPRLDAQTGAAIVPPTTALILERFDQDDGVFDAFTRGSSSLNPKSGDIAVEYERDVEVASRFLRHPLPRVRQWARREVESARSMARWWRDRKTLEALR